jgi:hypothetical protein
MNAIGNDNKNTEPLKAEIYFLRSQKENCLISSSHSGVVWYVMTCRPVEVHRTFKEGNASIFTVEK